MNSTALEAKIASDRSVAIGIALVLSSAVAWSTAGFFARMVPRDIWIVVFWRGVFGGLSIAALAMIDKRRFGFDFRAAFTLAGIALIPVFYRWLMPSSDLA